MVLREGSVGGAAVEGGAVSVVAGVAAGAVVDPVVGAEDMIATGVGCVCVGQGK